MNVTFVSTSKNNGPQALALLLSRLSSESGAEAAKAAPEPLVEPQAQTPKRAVEASCASK